MHVHITRDEMRESEYITDAEWTEKISDGECENIAYGGVYEEIKNEQMQGGWMQVSWDEKTINKVGAMVECWVRCRRSGDLSQISLHRHHAYLMQPPAVRPSIPARMCLPARAESSSRSDALAGPPGER